MNATITQVRRDETLYSAMARTGRVLGAQPRSALQLALVGADISVFDDMPIGLDLIVASGTFGAISVADALYEWTLLPYYAYYSSPAHARSVAGLMAGETGWPHEVLGSWTAAAPPPDRLRFCPTCFSGMGEQGGGAWWRRVHQLPSVLVCPDHGEPLRQSTVDRETRRRAYVAASPATCPSDAPLVVEIQEPRVLADLVVLARQSDLVLNDREEVHPDDRRDGYLEGLDHLGLMNRRGEAKLPALAQAMDRYWGSTLDLWPRLRREGRCEQAWLGTLLMSRHRSPPLHHILLELLLAALTRH